MGQPSTSIPRSVTVGNIIDMAFKVLIGAALVFLSLTVYDQRNERDCFFGLTTETDKIDSDIATKQAEIFAVAIRSPSGDSGPSPELVRLGQQLEGLISDRDVAYAKREDAAARCK